MLGDSQRRRYANELIRGSRSSLLLASLGAIIWTFLAGVVAPQEAFQKPPWQTSGRNIESSQIPATVGSNRASTETTSGRVLDLKSFGASGSIQTMTCSVIAGTTNLVKCSNGDFKADQGIRIPGVGILPNIQAPGQPALECTAGNGATCSGGTVYGYRIAAIQGGPNGPITAAGPPRMITQATQSPPPAVATSQTTPFVDTQVSWLPIKNASFYIIFKGINRKDYHFYAIVNRTKIDDYGVNWTPPTFTCAVLGVPCIAPNRPVANDVFARISLRTAHDYSLEPLTYPPRYFDQAGLPAGTYPNLPFVTQTRVTVYHDDTQAFQAIEHLLYTQISPRHATIVIPRGDYNVYAADQYGGRRVFTVLGMNNVTLTGAGPISKIHQVGDRSIYSMFIFAECGYDYRNAPGIHSSERCPRGTKTTSYQLTEPVAVGGLSIRLLAPVETSHFYKGEYVTIGVPPENRYPGSDYEELNRVRSIGWNTGVLNLYYPLTKTYSRSLPLPYSECATCAGEPRIWPMPYGPSFTNVTLQDFWFEGPVHFFDYNSGDYVTEKRLYVHSSDFDEKNPGFVRHASTIGNTVVQDGTLSIGPSLANGSAGSADILVSNNHESIFGDSSEQMCQEESANIKWINNEISITGDQSGDASAFGGAHCYGLTFAQNRLEIRKSVLGGVFSFISPVIADIRGNTMFIDKISKNKGGLGAPIVTNSVTAHDLGSSVRFYDNVWRVQTNLRSEVTVTRGHVATF